MIVRVRTIGLLRSLIRQGEFDVDLPDGARSRTCSRAWPRPTAAPSRRTSPRPCEPDAHPPLRVMVNGRDIGVLADRATVLAEGDDVLVLTPIAGG